MDASCSRPRFPLEHLAAVGVLALLMALTYAKFFFLPYAGFDFNASTGEVTLVYVEAPSGDSLATGDRLLRIGTLNWEDYATNLRQTLFDSRLPGDRVPLVVERSGEAVEIDWVLPGPTTEEIRERILGVLLVAYIFWLAGTASLLFVRPRDVRWRLLIAFCYLTAVWVASGSLSAWHLWGSAILLRVAVWLCLPVYMHFHWLFPRSLGRLPAWVWWGLYLVGGSLAILEVFQALPITAYLLGFVMAVAGSLVLLAAHVILQPDQRRDVGLVAFAALVVLAPLLLFGLTGALSEFPDLGSLVFLTLPLLPGAYLYAVYRRQAGGLEARANRLITVYLFAILVAMLAGVSIGLMAPLLRVSGLFALGGTIVSVLIAAASIAVFPRFQRFTERRLLRMPLPPAHLVEAYAERITTSLDRQSLVHLLRDEILSSLLVKQSALLYQEDRRDLEVIYLDGVDAVGLPQVGDLNDLAHQMGDARREAGLKLGDHPWALLILPLKLGGQTIGMWLLGRRDPDDYYAPAEVAILQVLANQTAIALSNILQAERLHAFYQTDMDRQEADRARFARWLHDDVLTELTALRMNVMETGTTGDFDQIWQTLVARIRQVMGGIRPVMLAYGLNEAIVELADDLSERASDGVAFEVDLPDTSIRYDERVEGHLFRIIQEACENAVQHADASVIRIYGELEPGRVDLSVADDGVGFEAGKALDLPGLLADRHFGLVTMYERAAIIGATLQIHSLPGQGTRIHLHCETEAI